MPSDDDPSSAILDDLDLRGYPVDSADESGERPFQTILIQKGTTTSLDSPGLPITADRGSFIVIQEAHAEVDWLLLPFVQRLKPSSSHTSAGNQKRLDTLKTAVDDALRPYKTVSGLDVPKGQAAGLIRSLLDAYKSFLARSKWNEISLSLASGVPKGWQRRVHSRLWPEALPWRPLENYREGWIWLHTGDAHLDDKSFRNIGDKVIDALPPEALSYVTAKPGDRKHPSSLIVSKLNARGIEVWPVLTDPHTQVFSRLWIHK
jgi:hypothetical protein